MTPGQRAATLGLCQAILACDCATPDLRARALRLQDRIQPWASLYAHFFGR